MKFAADLFCGAGGTTTGLLRAAKKRGIQLDMLAVNHLHEHFAMKTSDLPPFHRRKAARTSGNHRRN